MIHHIEMNVEAGEFTGLLGLPNLTEDDVVVITRPGRKVVIDQNRTNDDVVMAAHNLDGEGSQEDYEGVLILAHKPFVFERGGVRSG